MTGEWLAVEASVAGQTGVCSVEGGSPHREPPELLSKPTDPPSVYQWTLGGRWLLPSRVYFTSPSPREVGRGPG